jgi:hypothetical protein
MMHKTYITVTVKLIGIQVQQTETTRLAPGNTSNKTKHYLLSDDRARKHWQTQQKFVTNRD